MGFFVCEMMGNFEYPALFGTGDISFNIKFTYNNYTKNPTNVGLDVVKRVKLFQQYHLPCLPELTCLYHVQIETCTYW